jgi:hypothetical protein
MTDARNYNTSYPPSILRTTCYVPPAGVTGQILAKRSDTDYDVLWLDSSGTVAVSEVSISDTDPYVTFPGASDELWYDTTGQVLNARIAGAWVPISNPLVPVSEVAVADTDPYITDPAAVDELWYSTVAGQLFARVAGAWVPASPASADEVFVGNVTPGIDTELWYDTTTTPGVLKVKVSGSWVTVSSPPPPLDDYLPLHGGTLNGPLILFRYPAGVMEAAPAGWVLDQINKAPSGNEVLWSTTEPTDPGIELWYHPTDIPLTATVEEIVIGPDEPTNPAADLWYDTDSAVVMEDRFAALEARLAELEARLAGGE